jgi:anti-sigma factor RsiW
MSTGTQSKKLALRTAEDIYEELLKNPKDVTLNAEQAAAVYKLFTREPIRSDVVRGFKSRAFLQAALMSAIDGSFAMSWIRSIFF